MANQVAGSQTKVAADVAQLKTDVESLNSNLATQQNKTNGIDYTAIAQGIFSIHFTNDVDGHKMVLYFYASGSEAGKKIRLYDKTNNWSIVWNY